MITRKHVHREDRRDETRREATAYWAAKVASGRALRLAEAQTQDRVPLRSQATVQRQRLS